MNPLTLFYAKIVGAYLFIISLGLILNPQKARALLKEAKGSKAIMFIDGASATLVGIFMIITHTMAPGAWANTPAIIISSIAWFTFVIGVFEVVLPHKVVTSVYAVIPNRLWIAFNVLSLLIGAYLLYSGFTQ